MKSKAFIYIERVLKTNPKMISAVSENLKMIHVDNNDSRSVFRFSSEEFQKLKVMIKKEIMTRPNPLDRVEWWECFDRDGNYCEKKKESLLNMRHKMKGKTKVEANENALLQMYELYFPEMVGYSKNYKLKFAELLINEIRLMSGNIKQKEKNNKMYGRAELLGLI